MFAVAIACLLLIAVTTVLHYEVLSTVNLHLPAVRIPNRSKLLIVIFAEFAAHATEMAIYGFVMYFLIGTMAIGSLQGPAGFSLASCLYFSAETYTSLGFGDITPSGPVRLLAGVEALNGLLLIGWSASYAYIAMEKFWNSPKE
jgi:hypothetical protein